MYIKIHTLGTRRRFRESFDDFWNLGANLTRQGVTHTFIGLTATLRQDDVPDVMKRMSLSEVSLFRRSCYRYACMYINTHTYVHACSNRHDNLGTIWSGSLWSSKKKQM
jgi:hypothetical protein